MTRTRSVQTMPSSGPSRQISDGRATCMAQLKCYTAQEINITGVSNLFAATACFGSSRTFHTRGSRVSMPDYTRVFHLIHSLESSFPHSINSLIHDRAVSDPALVLTSKIKRRQSLQLPSTTTSEIHPAGRHGGNGGTSSPP